MNFRQATALDLIDVAPGTPVRLYAAKYKQGSPTALKDFTFEYAKIVKGPQHPTPNEQAKTWVMIACKGATWGYAHSEWTVFIGE